MDKRETDKAVSMQPDAQSPARRRFLEGAAGLAGVAATMGWPEVFAADDLGLPANLVAAARKEGMLVPYESFPTAQSQPMADGFTKEFGIPNKFFRAGQEALQTRLEAEIRGGRVLADTIGQGDFDVVQDMIDRGVVDVESRPALWDQYPEQWRISKFNNIPFATLSCNMIYNKNLVKAADAPKSWKDLVAPQWKGKVVIPSPEYAGTGFALLADWVRRYGWDFIKALKANETFIAQAVSDSDNRVISGQKMVGIANSHRGSTLIGQGAPIVFLWPTETPAIVLSYVHAVLKKAPNPNAARLYRDYCLTEKVQSSQAKFGLWSAHPKAKQPANLPALSEVPLQRLDWEHIRKERTKLLDGWRTIIRG